MVKKRKKPAETGDSSGAGGDANGASSEQPSHKKQYVEEANGDAK